MPTIITNTATEATQALKQTMIGLNTNGINPEMPAKQSLAIFKTFASKFLLFDWEFFSNELEYE